MTSSGKWLHRPATAAVLVLAAFAITGCGGAAEERATGPAATPAAGATGLIGPSSDGVPVPASWSNVANVQRYKAGAAALLPSGGVSVQSFSTTGGVSVTLPALRAQKARLTLRGAETAGKANLRLATGSSDPAYYAAPNGDLELLVDASELTTLLIYSDEPFSYELTTVALEPCPTCRTDEDLRREILDDLPELATTLKDDRARAAELILHWTSPRINFAFDRHTVQAAEQALATKPSAAQAIYEVSQDGGNAVYCGGASSILNRVLRLFGFDSFTLNFGDLRDDLTHVTVIVPLSVDGNTTFALFDPTFNSTFRDPSGRHLSYEELVRLSSRNAVGRVTVNFQPMPDRQYVFAGAATPERCDRIANTHGPFSKCTIESFTLDDYLTTFADKLEANGYPATLQGFSMLMSTEVFGVGSLTRPAQVNELLKRLDALDVEVPDQVEQISP